MTTMRTHLREDTRVRVHDTVPAVSFYSGAAFTPTDVGLTVVCRSAGQAREVARAFLEVADERRDQAGVRP